MGRSGSDDRQKKHKTSREKREYLENLKPTIDLVALGTQTGFSAEVITSAFEPSKTKRRTWLRNKRKENGIFKLGNKNPEKLETFLSFEKKYQLEFKKVEEGKYDLEKLIEFSHRIETFAPGSGLIHVAIRHIGKNFFKKELAPAWNGD